VWSVACTPDGQRFTSGSENKTIRVWDSFPHFSPTSPPLVRIPIRANFYTPPDPDGYVRLDTQRIARCIEYTGLHSCALLILFLTSHSRSIPFTLRTLLLDPVGPIFSFSTLHSPSISFLPAV